MSRTYHLPPGSVVPLQNWNPMLHLMWLVWWTDDHHFNPYMHRRVCGLMRRPSDGFVFWDEDALDLGSGDKTRPISRLTWDDVEDEIDPIVCLNPEEWDNLEFVEEATEEDYFRALNTELASTKERELGIRKKLLQIHNHPVRYGEYLPDSSRHYANREALLAMLSPEDPKELILMVEIHREARAIDKARELLEVVPEDDDFFSGKIKKIRELCDEAIAEVSIWDGEIRKPERCWEHSRMLRIS